VQRIASGRPLLRFSEPQKALLHIKIVEKLSYESDEFAKSSIPIVVLDGVEESMLMVPYTGKFLGVFEDYESIKYDGEDVFYFDCDIRYEIGGILLKKDFELKGVPMYVPSSRIIEATVRLTCHIVSKDREVNEDLSNIQIDLTPTISPDINILTIKDFITNHKNTFPIESKQLEDADEYLIRVGIIRGELAKHVSLLLMYKINTINNEALKHLLTSQGQSEIEELQLRVLYSKERIYNNAAHIKTLDARLAESNSRLIDEATAYALRFDTRWIEKTRNRLMRESADHEADIPVLEKRIEERREQLRLRVE
jgi:hypothetical protein